MKADEAMSSEARKAEEGIARVFGRAAATYDRIGRFTHYGERLVERAQLAPGVTVLDVAAGRGAVMFPAAKRVGPHGRVIGIDISADMLRETAREMEGAPWQNVELQQMDAEQLQFPDGAFDWVLCGFALWFFPHPHHALREFYRVLNDCIIAKEDLLWEDLWSTGFRRHFEQMTATVLERVRADLYQKLQALRRPDGIHAVYRALFACAAK
jgi:SAM-dependent methyltransferase